MILLSLLIPSPYHFWAHYFPSLWFSTFLKFCFFLLLWLPGILSFLLEFYYFSLQRSSVFTFTAISAFCIHLVLPSLSLARLISASYFQTKPCFMQWVVFASSQFWHSPPSPLWFIKTNQEEKPTLCLIQGWWVIGSFPSLTQWPPSNTNNQRWCAILSSH